MEVKSNGWIQEITCIKDSMVVLTIFKQIIHKFLYEFR